MLIVEDHRVLAQGLELAFSFQDGMEVVGTAATAAEALEKARELSPDVVLMDFHLPDATGAQATREIKTATAKPPAVVILSGDTSDEAMLEAIEAGVCAYLSKTEVASRVAETVRQAAQGEMLMDPKTLIRLMNVQKQRHQDGQARERLRNSLTQRELDILRLMAQGQDSRQMAEQLHLSVATVRGYVQDIIEKLGAHSRLEAVALATAHRLLTPD